ncbi:MAG: tetratricopeptide repeat protein [Betaproteobacteria bacterium]
MRIRVAIVTACTLASAAQSLHADPRVPVDDREVVERLPVAPGAEAQELRALRAALAQTPGDLGLAVRVARGYVAIGRSTGDPRYAGYAQAALAPWWHLADPPIEVQVLRATLRQRVHDFDGALADLDAVLARAPRNAQARLTRATVLTVQSRLDEAAQECARLKGLVDELIALACSENVGGLTGRLRQSEARLRAALARSTDTDPGTHSWVAAGLAEMAERAGNTEAAAAGFRDALAADPDDVYSLAAYADQLLDHDRPEAVIRLLKARTRVDGLLLRYALAAQRLGRDDALSSIEQLRARFDVSRRRGDRVHLREEARFLLHLARDVPGALTVAKENWSVQKEPADARILLEAALAARDEAWRRVVESWVALHHLEDAKLTNMLRKSNPIRN